ncbi:MAG: hypothetical protein U9R50_11820 [Campylobacterota bacterium]|nr:hypothetical protein [Campylobacterota bacterium]
MKPYDYITSQEINRLAFRAYFNKLKNDTTGMKLLGKQQFYKEAILYLLNIETAMHRIKRDSIASGFEHIVQKLSHENEDKGFKLGLSEAKSELSKMLFPQN